MKRYLLLFLLMSGLAASRGENANTLSAPSLISETQTVSLNMPDVPIVDALRMLAKLGNINLIVDSNVQGSVNLFFEDVPFEEAWNALLNSASLHSEKQGSLVHVFPGPVTAQQTSGIRTQVYRLKYITLGKTEFSGGSTGSSNSQRSNNSSSTSSSSSSSLGSNSGLSGQGESSQETSLDAILTSSFSDRDLKVSKDERTNHIILTGPPELLQEALALIEALDRPVEQILIQARVIQARMKALDELGIHWGGIYTLKNSGGISLTTGRNSNDPGEIITETAQESGTFSSTLNDFNVTVAALLENGDARVLSSPRVVTQNNREAFISSGQEIQVPSGLDINGNATYRERQVTLELGVTPRVLGGAQINLSIRLRNDSINYEQQQVSSVPPLNVNTVESIVSLSNRDTVVIGGIITETDTYNTFNVPVLSAIPLLGSVFKHRLKSKENTELLILITPTIITNEEGVVIQENSFDTDAFWEESNPFPDNSKEKNKNAGRSRQIPDRQIRRGAKNFHSKR